MNKKIIVTAFLLAAGLYKWWNFTTNAKYLNYFRIGGKILGTAGTMITLGKAVKGWSLAPIQ